ncbi:MAG: GAF domain-containing protein [Chloroflexi bacterium]|nr:GAF domain-containing protein [Chloroflexota bacterium]
MTIDSYINENTAIVLHAVPDAVLVIDGNGAIRFLNKNAEALTGYSRDELSGLTVEKLVPASRRGTHKRRRAQYHLAPTQREMYSRGDLWLQKKDSTLVPVAIDLSLLADSEQGAVLCTIRDVSDQERRSKGDILLSEISSLIGKEHEIEKVYDMLADSLPILFQFDRLVITLKIAGTDQLERVFVSGLTSPDSGVKTRIPAPEVMSISPGPLPETSLAGSQELITANGRQLGSMGLKSWVEVPLGDPDAPSGYLSLRSLMADCYSEADVHLLERVATLISPSFELARLYAQSRREVNERTVMAEVSRIITSSTDIQRVYAEVADQIRKLIPFDRIVVSTVDREKNIATDRYVAGLQMEGGEVGDTYELSTSLTGLFLNESEPRALTVAEVTAQYPGVASRLGAGLKSVLTAPIIWSDETIGLLILRSRQDQAYSEVESALAMKIANQISGAVANAELYAGLEREKEVAEILAEISRAITSSPDIAQTLTEVVHQIRRLMPVDRLVISDVDEKAKTYKLRWSWGGKDGRLQSGPQRLEGTGTERVFLSRSAALINEEDVADIASFTNPDGPDLNQDMKSWIAVPLFVNGAGIGVLHIRTRKRKAYGDREVRIAENIAAQMAGALSVSRAHELSLISEQSRIIAEAEKRELEAVEEQRDYFLSTISHELKTPLTSLIAFADFLARDRESNLSDRQMQQIHVMQRSARRLDVLVNDLLDISRIDAGTIVLEVREFDLQILLTEIIDEFQPVFREKQQTLKLSFAPKGVQICGDRNRIAQVISNLLSNASKYSYERSEISLDVERELGILAITVSDNGIGIGAEDQIKLFTPFFRAGDPLTQGEPGTGLGLVIVKRLIDLHGGETSITSEKGVGTRVRVTIPECAVDVHLGYHEDTVEHSESP